MTVPLSGKSDELRVALRRMKRQVVRRVAARQGWRLTDSSIASVHAHTDLATLSLKDLVAKGKAMAPPGTTGGGHLAGVRPPATLKGLELSSAGHLIVVPGVIAVNLLAGVAVTFLAGDYPGLQVVSGYFAMVTTWLVALFVFLTAR